MLRLCPECNLQVSDKALFCPHCGMPFKVEQVKKVYSKNKRKRLPNGFGQISEIKNKNLRNPFRAMVTCGVNEYGKPISKLLKPKAYFPTYNDAYAALVEYNQNPYDFASNITFKELYEKWSDKFYKKVSESSIQSYEISYKYCSDIYDLPVRDLRIRHLKHCLEKGTIEDGSKPTLNRQKTIKYLFSKMFDYAVEYEIVDANPFRNIKVTMEGESKNYTHSAFTDNEMKILWDNLGKEDDIDIVLIQCYSGWRPNELLKMKIEDVDLKNWTFTSGSKTKSGINRTVPIHSKIKPLVEKRYTSSVRRNKPTLFNYKDWEYSYNHYAYVISQLNTKLNLDIEHKPHDPRKHFITMAKKYKVDEYAIKYLVGHAITDITENVYTERGIDWLREEIEKIEK